MAMQVEEEVTKFERLSLFVCDGAAAVLDSCSSVNDDVIEELLSSRCFFFFFGNVCFLAGPSNSATSALSVPVGGGGFLVPPSRALRR